MSDVQQSGTLLNAADAYEIVANWHDKNANGCIDIALDEPRIPFDVRQRAFEAAKHHRASAAGLRLAATDMRRRMFAIPE